MQKSFVPLLFSAPKLENHAAHVALYVMDYNFRRKHMTLGTTPAVKAGIADHVWTIQELLSDRI